MWQRAKLQCKDIYNLRGCRPSLIASDPEWLKTGLLKLSKGDIDICCANDLKQSTRLMQSEIAKKTGIYCLSESTSPSNILALIRQISDFASECRWSRLARSSVVNDVQFPFVCRCTKNQHLVHLIIPQKLNWKCITWIARSGRIAEAFATRWNPLRELWETYTQFILIKSNWNIHSVQLSVNNLRHGLVNISYWSDNKVDAKKTFKDEMSYSSRNRSAWAWMSSTTSLKVCHHVI